MWRKEEKEYRGKFRGDENQNISGEVGGGPGLRLMRMG